MSEQPLIIDGMECAHEWSVCVEAELQELQERVSERVKRRVMENIRRAGVVEALAMPYRRDVVTAEASYEARECVRDMRRHLVSDLRDLTATCGPTTRGLGLYLEYGKSIIATRRYTTLVIAIVLDAITLYFLSEPAETLFRVGKQMIAMLGSAMEGGVGTAEVGGGILSRVPSSVTQFGSKIEQVVEIVQYVGSAMQAFVALIKMGVLLWFLSKLHKVLVRGEVKVQTRQIVGQLVKFLREQLAVRNIPQIFKNPSDNSAQ